MQRVIQDFSKAMNLLRSVMREFFSLDRYMTQSQDLNRLSCILFSASTLCPETSSSEFKSSGPSSLLDSNLAPALFSSLVLEDHELSDRPTNLCIFPNYSQILHSCFFATCVSTLTVTTFTLCAASPISDQILPYKSSHNDRLSIVQV